MTRATQDFLVGYILGLLQNNMKDHQAQDVEDAAVKAGLWWRCAAEQWVNGSAEKVCGCGCGAFRPNTVIKFSGEVNDYLRRNILNVLTGETTGAHADALANVIMDEL